jgi:uncharacterized membrane protein YccC
MSDQDPTARGWSYADEASSRVRAIVSAAEAEAEALLEAARRDADRLAAKRMRRLTALTDDLVERADQLLGQMDEAVTLRRRLDELVRTIGATAEEIARDAGGRPAAPEAETRPARAPLDDARLVAAEMAAAGAPGRQIEAELRGSFGIADPSPIVADVLAQRAAGRLGDDADGSLN